MQIKKQFFNDQFLFFHRKTEGQQATKVFAKAGLDIVTSSMCRHQQWFRLDVQCSALVHNFNIIFSNEHLYRAGRAMNSLPSQILERYMPFLMTPKKFIALLFISVVLLLSLTLLGGHSIGHDIKFLIASLAYYAFTTYSLGLVKTNKEILLTVLIIILPPSAILMPFHIIDYKETQIAFLSTLGHYLGVLFGILTHFTKQKVKFLSGIILVAISVWTSFVGYNYWLHKVNFGTFTGKAYDQSPGQLLGLNQFGQKITDETFKNKLVVLDFWHTRCGVCFQKFPLLQILYDKYRLDTTIKIVAVNRPLKQDTIGQAFSMLQSRGYNFPILIPSIDSLPEKYRVTSYPTTIVIDKSGNIIYRGEIENVNPVITKVLKNGM